MVVKIQYSRIYEFIQIVPRRLSFIFLAQIRFTTRLLALLIKKSRCARRLQY